MLTVNQVYTFQVMIASVIPNPHWKNRFRASVLNVPVVPETPVSSSSTVATGKDSFSYSIHCLRSRTLRHRLIVSMAPIRSPHHKRTENHSAQGKAVPGTSPS